jgi:hypothetical protein
VYEYVSHYWNTRILLELLAVEANIRPRKRPGLACSEEKVTVTYGDARCITPFVIQRLQTVFSELICS